MKLEILARVVDAAAAGLDAFGDVLYAMMINPKKTVGPAADAAGAAFTNKFGESANKLIRNFRF